MLDIFIISCIFNVIIWIYALIVRFSLNVIIITDGRI